MANSVIGALRVTLGLDTAQFSEGLKKSQSGLQAWGKTAGIAAAAIVSTMVTTGIAVGAAIKRMIDDADEMSKMSQKIGIPVDELSRLRYAADLSDVSLEELSKSVKRLSANMLDVAQGGIGPAAKAFDALGVKAQDANGVLRPATQVLADLSGKFAEMEDGTTKTALAMAIFGKSGADLIPMLNSGGEAMREMYAEAEELGIVLDARTGKAAEAFNDNLTRLGRVKDGIIQKIGAGMLPALEQMSAALVGAAKNTQFMDAVGKILGATLKVLLTAAVGAGYAIASIGMTLGAVGTAMSRFVHGDFAGAAEVLSTTNARIKTLGKGADDLVAALWKPAPALKATASAAGAAAPAIENYSKSTAKATKATKEETDAERERQRVLDEGARLTESLRTAEEVYSDEKKRNNELLEQGAISLETYARAMAKATDTYEDFIAARNKAALDNQDPFGIDAMMRDLEKSDAERAKAAADLANQTESDLKNATFDGIAGGLYAVADSNLGKYLASVLQRNLVESLAGSLTELISSRGGGGGGGWLKAAASFFSGFPGFKTGGSFKVGGSGGADSQLMAFKATPGEMVDIRKPGQMRDAEATEVVVSPSPYFDVRVRKVAQPIADLAERRSVAASAKLASRGLPGLQASQRRLGTAT